MNTIEARRRDVDPDLIRTGVPPMEPNIAGPTVVIDAETGDPVALIDRYRGDLARYRWAMRAMPMDETVRLGGSRNPSRTFGYAARKEMLRRHACRCSSAALDAPEAHSVIASASDVLAAHLVDVLPRRAELDRELATAAIQPDWFMGGWWTSGVVNQSSPLPYHFDANNMRCWSSMVVVRRGARGGHLHVPAYDLVLPCRDGDVLFFAGYELMHGVTPLTLDRNITGGKRDAYRLSAVYYTVAAMKNCTEFDDGFQTGRKNRSIAEDTMRERQRALGLLQ